METFERERMAWGVVFSSPTGRSPMLLGELWAGERESHARALHTMGAPFRTLMFSTRREARDWCQKLTRNYRESYSIDHVCHGWKFTPVRLREHVKVVRRKA